MKFLQQKEKALIVIALSCLVLLSVPTALSYFTTYVEVKGSKEVVMVEETRFKEEVIEDGKLVTITAADNSDPVYVRVRVFLADDLKEYLTVDTGEGWKAEGDYYVYQAPLHAGESASLPVLLKGVPEDHPPFGVTVIYESVPALCNEKGELYCDWDYDMILEGGH